MLGGTADDATARDEMRRLVRAVEMGSQPDTLGQFVKECVRRNGSRQLANFFDDGSTLTYGELEESARCLASRLQDRGVRKGTHVAVMLGNGPAYPITWVALGLIGAVIVPVNTAYQISDLTFVLVDSDAQFLVIEEEFLKLLGKVLHEAPLISAARVIVYGSRNGEYESWRDLVNGGDGGFSAPTAVSSTDLLNIQYTSGTTGFPKGCMLSHDYWMLLTEFAAAPHHESGKIEQILIWQPFFYMDGMWLLLLTMRLGATAHVAKRMQLSSFYDWLIKFQINYCIFPEAALKVKVPRSYDRKLALQYMSIYGWSAASRMLAVGRFQAVVREGYGMTEIGLALLVPNGAQHRATDVTCGLPGPHRSFRIVDEFGADVEDGLVGELWVKGRGILWGYYKRADANVDSFRGEWFRTGDLGYRDAGGWYYLVGRSKDMIRRSGENIAAKEVESVICQLEQVAEVAVVGVSDSLRGQEVKAFILLRPGQSPESCPPALIWDHCSRLLAAFKVPRFITYVVGDFPRTPSRKIRKKETVVEAESKGLTVYDRQSTH